MGNQNIYVFLKSLIYKKGLLFYLESWGFSPQSISKESLISASTAFDGKKKLLICDQEFFSSNPIIRKNFSSLIHISKDANQSKSSLIELGIDGAFDHTISPAELQQAIRLIQQGGKYIQPGIFNNSSGKTAQLIPAELTALSDLTSREREVLRHIANELTNKEIAKLLFISPRTVETHRRNLIQKMKVKNSVGLVKAYLKARSIAG